MYWKCSRLPVITILDDIIFKLRVRVHGRAMSSWTLDVDTIRWFHWMCRPLIIIFIFMKSLRDLLKYLLHWLVTATISTAGWFCHGHMVWYLSPLLHEAAWLVSIRRWHQMLLLLMVIIISFICTLELQLILFGSLFFLVGMSIVGRLIEYLNYLFNGKFNRVRRVTHVVNHHV